MQGKNETSLEKAYRKRASTPQYVSPNQLVLVGFETPFEQQLTKNNRWVKLNGLIPWDKIVGQYDVQFKSSEGRPPISGRIVLGALIIKHILNLTDEETIHQIEENMFMQYFLGYSSFTNESIFSPTLFVEIRKRLNQAIVNNISEIVVAHQKEIEENRVKKDKDKPDDNDLLNEAITVIKPEELAIEADTNEGTLIMDATVAPQNITYPTDLKLLNAAREKSEELIDKLYNKEIHGVIKVRTYRELARKDFLNAIKKKTKSFKEIYKWNGSQIRYLKRNLAHIELLLKGYETKGLNHTLKKKDLLYIETLQTVYEQQETMHRTQTRSIENRIVNIHQPHVRPIKRGKAGKQTEFGSKLQVSLVNGFTFLDKLSWDNFNEGGDLQASVEKFKTRCGHYPKQVLADQIYCTRVNRAWLKERHIKLSAKPLGRPTKEALSNQVSPGERNPIEGKFGQGKVAYGLDNIKAKLKDTSESWIATIILVLNLVNLTRLATLCHKFIDEIITLLFYDIKINRLSL
ncbi:MAG: IS5 family transposase [Cytophagales bacterium]